MRKDMDRSELDRLINRKPRWFIRWGMTILLAIMILVFMVIKGALAP
jgi:hypothetical protein